MEPIDRRSDSRSISIAATPAQVFAAMSEPARIARWWGPDGKDYPNESRFTRIVPAELFEIEHLNGHHFILCIALKPSEQGTHVHWRQTFDTVEHYEQLSQFVAGANEQNLRRLAAEVLRSGNAA